VPFLGGLIPNRDSVPLQRYLDAWTALAEPLAFMGGLTLPLLFLVLVLWWHTRSEFTEPDGSGALNPWIYAMWFGVVVGIGEGAYGLLKTEFFKEYPWELKDLSVHAVGMASLNHVAVNLLICAALLGLGAFWSKSRDTLLAFAFPFLGVLSWIGATGRIHIVASLILAVGVGLRVAGSRPFRSAVLGVFMRRTLPVGIGAVLLFTAAVPFAQQRAERAQRDARAADPARPNVVLLVLDTQRSFNMGLYGYDRPTTPEMDALAEAGVVFDQAVSPAPWTLPAHASMFTGRWPHELGLGFQIPLDETYPTLAETLSEHGYVTGAFSANLEFTTPLWGVGRGFHRFDAVPVSWPAILKQTWLIRWPWKQVLDLRGKHDYMVLNPASRINRWFLDWETQREGRPFFAFLNFFEAHEPYDPPPEFAGRFGSTPGGLDWLLHGNRSESYSEEELVEMVARYDEDVAAGDRAVGDLFRALAERGLLENTIVIITADHGEGFGEHGYMNHVETVHTPSVHVPLILSFPSAPSGLRVRTPVSTRDIAATVLDMVGVPEHPLPGVSLERFWTGGDTSTGPVLAELGAIRSVFSDLHYIRYANGEEELFDWFADPLELDNLIGSRSLDHARMANLLDTLLAPTASGPDSSNPSGR